MDLNRVHQDLGTLHHRYSKCKAAAADMEEHREVDREAVVAVEVVRRPGTRRRRHQEAAVVEVEVVEAGRVPNTITRRTHSGTLRLLRPGAVRRPRLHSSRVEGRRPHNSRRHSLQVSSANRPIRHIRWSVLHTAAHPRTRGAVRLGAVHTSRLSSSSNSSKVAPLMAPGRVRRPRRGVPTAASDGSPRLHRPARPQVQLSRPRNPLPSHSHRLRHRSSISHSLAALNKLQRPMHTHLIQGICMEATAMTAAVVVGPAGRREHPTPRAA